MSSIRKELGFDCVCLWVINFTKDHASLRCVWWELDFHAMLKLMFHICVWPPMIYKHECLYIYLYDENEEFMENWECKSQWTSLGLDLLRITCLSVVMSCLSANLSRVWL